MRAFLDDIYLLCPPSRVQHLHKVLTEALSRHAGIQLHQGKTKTWNHAGIVPENVETLGPHITVLAHRLDPLNTSSARWMSASPRSERRQPHHAHDATVPIIGLLSRPTTLECGTQQGSSWGTFPATGKRRRDSCPRCRCGLRSAELLAPAAFWATWADACHDQRKSEIASEVVRRLDATIPVRHVWHWTRKGFGGDPVGLSSERGKDHHKHARDPGELFHFMADSTGHLPSSTLVFGRCHFCQANQLLAKLSDRTPQVGIGARSLLVSSPSLHTFAMCYSWSCSCC